MQKITKNFQHVFCFTLLIEEDIKNFVQKLLQSDEVVLFFIDNGVKLLLAKRALEKPPLMTVENIQNRVYVMRGQQVMLDYDLAELYGYEVKRLNAQVKNNISRFPEDFMFQLTKSEVENLRSNFSTANINPKSRALPHAFTEQGIYMLATVLRGELAEQQSIFIMRAFREMRHYIKQNQQFVTQSEMHLVSARVSEISVQMR